MSQAMPAPPGPGVAISRGAAPAPAPDLVAGYARHGGRISILMARHHLRVLNAAYARFDQDLRLALLALEVWRHAAATGGPTSEYRHRVAALPDAVGLPRETTRRHLCRLAELGWLRIAGRGHVAPTAALDAAFHPAQAFWMLEDFRHTATGLRATLTMDATAPERAMLRRQLTDAARTAPPSVPAEPPNQPACTAVALALGRHLADYHQRHFRRLQAAFDGDLLLPLLLGELAHYGISAVLRNPAADLAAVDALLAPATERALLPTLGRACNAHSLALATGVPDSTVRRKLERLIERGWVLRGENGDLRHAAGLAQRFAALNLETLGDFMATDERMRALLAER